MEGVLLTAVLRQLVEHIEEQMDGEEAVRKMSLFTVVIGLKSHNLVELVENYVEAFGGV